MKLISVILLTALAFCSCKDGAKEEKAQFTEILKVHDKLMANDDALMKNKMKLDSLLKLKLKDSLEIKAADTKLSSADDAMGTWMHHFNPDVSGKSHDEVMKYYADQKKQIMAVDSQINSAITESGKYLSNHGIK
jgi:hypothetical protein